MSTTPTGTTGGDYCPACGSAGMRGRTHACVPASAAPISAEDLTKAYFSVDPYAATIADILLRLVALERRDTPDESSACDCNAAGIMQDLDSAYADLDKVKAERDAAIARAETAEGERDRWKAARDVNYKDALRFHDERDAMEKERDEARKHQSAAFDSMCMALAERDAERERAGRLEVRIAKLRRCLERFTASGSWLPDLGRTWAAFALSEDDAALALPASDTKENGDE